MSASCVRVRSSAWSTKQKWTTAMTEPPASTRAYFRGRCLGRWPDAVVAANWDSLILDVGTDPLRRIPMMEPLRGTRPMSRRCSRNARPRPSSWPGWRRQ